MYGLVINALLSVGAGAGRIAENGAVRQPLGPATGVRHAWVARSPFRYHRPLGCPITSPSAPPAASRSPRRASAARARRPVNAGHLARTVDRLALHQIDSVNVLVRAHYLPAFSRLGAYDRGLLDRAAWGAAARERRLFEYWAHEASLLPLELHPLLRWRMARADRGEAGWGRLRAFADERRAEAEAVLARIRAEGPLAASDFEDGRAPAAGGNGATPRPRSNCCSGPATSPPATRRGSFERVYDLTERVIPPRILGAADAGRGRRAPRAWSTVAARALGIATARRPARLFPPRPGRSARRDRRAGRGGRCCSPSTVEGWRAPAFLHRDARRPRRILRPGPARPVRSPDLGARPHRAPVRLPLPHRASTPPPTSASTAIMSCPS